MYLVCMCLFLVFNLTNGIDVKETEERIAEYRKENQDVIKKNKSKLVLCDYIVLACRMLCLQRQLTGNSR